MCMEDVRIGRHTFFRQTVSTTQANLNPDPKRIGIVFAYQGSAVTGRGISLFPRPETGAGAIATLNDSIASVYLSVRDYGTLLTGPLAAIEMNGVATNFSLTEILLLDDNVNGEPDDE